MKRCQVVGCSRAAMLSFNGERCRVCGFCMHDHFGGRNPGAVEVGRFNSGQSPDLLFFDEVDRLTAPRDWRKDLPLGVPPSAWAMPAGSLPGQSELLRQCAKAYSFGVAAGLSPTGRTLESCYEQIMGRLKRNGLPPVLDPYYSAEAFLRELRSLPKKWDGWR